MNRQNFNTQFFITILFVVFFSRCTKQDTIEKSKTFNSTSIEQSLAVVKQNNDSLVLTPFGYKEKSKVHFLPPDHELIESNNRLLEMDSRTKKVINAAA